MNMKQGRRIFSLNYLFASFFGALMIASAFAYFNYRFSQYKFIDFSNWIYYEKSDLFVPKYDEYTVVVYSSNMQKIGKILQKIGNKKHILAIDLYQKRRENSKNVIYITTGMNDLLKLIQRFHIMEVPSVFQIKKQKNSRYKQDSMIEKIE
ncbi:MAG: hypothetical protein GXP61_02700 [Epsilonproteobacteria bacterium]|nr:hypothetical protein [Campylobacterota bacterium]